MEKFKMEGEKVSKMNRGLFFFFFLARHFLKPLKFVWCLPKWTIFIGKNHITRKEKNREN